MSERIGYEQVTEAAAETIKTGPAGFFGFVCVSSTAGTITVYDNTSAAGTVLYAKDALAKGDAVHLGGLGLAAKNGLHVVIGGAATVNVMYN